MAWSLIVYKVLSVYLISLETQSGPLAWKMIIVAFLWIHSLNHGHESQNPYPMLLDSLPSVHFFGHTASL